MNFKNKKKKKKSWKNYAIQLKTHMTCVGTLPQLIGFIRFGEPVPHGLSARHRVWAGPTKG